MLKDAITPLMSTGKLAVAFDNQQSLMKLDPDKGKKLKIGLGEVRD